VKKPGMIIDVSQDIDWIYGPGIQGLLEGGDGHEKEIPTITCDFGFKYSL
jgi:hypothetical protein